MDLHMLDKSEVMKPLLVKLYDSHQLYSLAKDKCPSARSELIAIITELLDAELSEAESELIADVMIQLMKQVEIDLRRAVALHLAERHDVPLRIILHLANDEIEVADPILSLSPILSDLDLIYFVKSKTSNYWQSIAKRQSLSDSLINMLSETRDLGTAQTLVENMNITLTPHSIDILAELTPTSEMLEEAFLKREDIPESIINKIYNTISEELREQAVQRFGVEEKVIDQAIDDSVQTLKEERYESNWEFAPSHSMIEAARRQKQKNILSMKLIMNTLRSGDLPAFVAQFSALTNLHPKLTEKSLVQKSGRGLAVVCKASRISKADFISIYLLTNAVRNKGKIAETADISNAANFYNDMTEEACGELLEAESQKYA